MKLIYENEALSIELILKGTNAGRSTNWTKTARESPTAKAAGRTTGRTLPTGTTREM